MDNAILTYWQGIHDGDIIVGKWVRLLYQLIVDRIGDGTYVYDPQKANRAIRFIEKFCRHNKGIKGGELLELSLWQRALISVIFGVCDHKGRRQFREVVLVVGRQCGQSLVAAAIITFVAFVDGEFGSEIYCIAPKLDQSKLVYDAFAFNCDNSESLAQAIKRRQTDMYIECNNTFVQMIAFNERKSDGYNPMLVECDEIHSWPPERGLQQYESLLSGTGARVEPMVVSTSSAGYINGGIYDELIKRGTAFLLGHSEEQHILPVLYMIDDINRWDDVNELQKSLPGMGVSVSVDFVLSEISTARISPSKKAEFITQYCNLQQSGTQAWLPSEWVQACRGEPFRLENFRGHYCVVGVDLSMTTDLTAAVVVVQHEGLYYVFAHFWLPETKLDEATERDGLPYRIYIEQGFLSLSAGAVVDYRDVRDYIFGLVKTYRMYPLFVGYDSYSARPLVQELEAASFHLDSVRQGENLTGIINETEGLFHNGLIRIGDNDLLATHLLDASLQINNTSGRKKLVKQRANAHVDGMAALLDAICMVQVHHAEIGRQLLNEGKPLAK